MSILWRRARKQAPGDGLGAKAFEQGTEREEVLLLARVARGEMQAFETLYRAYHPRLSRFLSRMTRRTDLVDETLNDTLHVVWLRADRFDGSAKVSTWIFAIAYRQALKALRRFDEPVEDALELTRPTSAPGPEQLTGLGQMRAALAKAIDGLSAEHRAVVDLAYFHGMTCQDIAEIVGCPTDTVKTRMFYARKRLRERLSGELEDWL
jgi:RNA polymerase sigma-70 factor (ECF subfamily)